MPQATKPSRQPVTVKYNSRDEDQSAMQLAAMVFALRDSHVALFAELTKSPISKIENAIDDSYERYLDDLMQQVKEYREGGSVS